MNTGKYILCIMMSVVLFLLMADNNNIAYISFLGRSAVDPKFCLLFDLFTSKIYTYPMKKKKKKKKLKKKKKNYYFIKTEKKRLGKMRLQTDQEFKQRNIEELNKKFNVKMYSTHFT